MPISEEVRSHGYVLLQLWEQLSSNLPNANFNLSTGSSRSAYVIKSNIPAMLGRGRKASAGIFVKVSNKRASPWRYAFLQQHQDEIKALKDEYGEVFVAFVNGQDGVACVDYSVLKLVLDEHHQDQEWVAITRKLHQNYRISGKDGDGERLLPKNNFPQAIVKYFLGVIG